MRSHWYSAAVAACLSAPAFSAPVFELQAGDRVAMLGDTFIEREQYEGWIELALTTRFPDQAVTFRNLGWSADTPAGDSRTGLSLLQAGLEPPEEGWRQLQDQLATYKPNVVILGYGMAASLAGGMSPEEFRENLGRLIDSAPKAAGNEVRFLVLGIPPRFERPADDPEKLKIHRESIRALNRVLEETAAEREFPFISLDHLGQDPALSENGIHLTSAGYKAVARHIEKVLGWKRTAWDEGESADSLRKHILKKNEWFFHRSRPANMAYIFGFRQKEQGNNAGEILEFDKLVAKQDEIISRMRDLSKNVVVPEEAPRTNSVFAAKVSQPYPEFTVAEGYEVSLWAENPLLHKPTQMNFDPEGRLWVASSETYPQVEVGQTPDDKIIVLEDSNGDGKADQSTVFADGLLMPTGLIPGDGGVYVAQSTDLLHLKDTDGDGKSDRMTRVLSGFGTEDTHHNLHTLRRGPDGRIWMNQSIYTRTDAETPGGVFRLKSGGIMRFDPRTLDLSTVFYGWINSWGHQFDRYGQSFVTDGAGGGGINWGVPGAMYAAYARAPRILGSVSPGSYPKFSGLEIIGSPHFPDDWQGSMVTCDFRAHRIVRFGISDQGAGYVTQELGDLLRCDDVNFRPIDIKIGPDGALYIADWSNPIINHGEVDFRDPRRDREHGRIWKVTRKGAPLATWKNVSLLPADELLDALASDDRFLREQATAVLFESETGKFAAEIAEWKVAADDERTLLAAMWLSQGRNEHDMELLKRVLSHENGAARAAAFRVLGDWLPALDPSEALAILRAGVSDEFGRVRIEAIRVLSKLPGWEPMDVALGALEKPMDRFLDYALWLNVQEHGEEWLAALLDKSIDANKRGSALEYVLSNLPAAKAADAIAAVMPKPLPSDGSGPWLNLALKTGNAGVIKSIYRQAVTGGFDAGTTLLAIRGLSEAVSLRQIELKEDWSKLLDWISGGDLPIRSAAMELAGAIQADDALPRLIEIASSDANALELRLSAVGALSHYRTPAAREALIALAESKVPPEVRQQAVLSLARHHQGRAVPLIAAVAAESKDAGAARGFWQKAMSSKGISAHLAKAFEARPLSAEAAGLTLQNIPDVPEHDDLLQVLRRQAGAGEAKTYSAGEIKTMAAQAAEHGDAARGEMIYRRNALACVACHAIGGAGGKVGPDMTSLGASAPLDYIIESVVLPGAKIKEGYHSVTVETKDGKAIMGQLIRSSGGSTVIRDAAGTEVTVADNMIVKKTDAGSLMPGNLINGLPEQEVNDLFKFLSQLGKPGEFDATKSNAPKVWAVLPLRTEIQEAASIGDPSLPWVPVNATVNGRLLPRDLNHSGGEVMIATKLQLAEPAKLSLEFINGFKPTAIWISGKPASSGSADLEPGVHTIVVRCTPGDAPILMKSEAGTFLPEW